VSAGIQPNLATINQQAGSLMVNLLNSIEQAQVFYQYLNGLGSSGLIALGMASADATALLSAYSNANALANVFYGQAYTGPALPYNFYNQIVPLTGGQ
jgi:hypothetical protein